MPWEPRSYKGDKVWIRVDDDSSPLIQNDRVDMKHEKDEAQYYQASPDNITLLPEDYDHQNPIEDDRIEAYTDGSSIQASRQSGPQQGGPIGVGVVFRSRDGYRELSEPAGEGNNITSELDAIRLALDTINERERPVRIYTDSEYAVNALTDWIHNWRQNNWKKSNGDPVSHQDHLKTISSLMEEFDDLEINWVEGHAGHVFNERADNLAADAAREQKNS